MSKQTKHIFVVGLDEFNKRKLERLPLAAECAFHPALDVREVRGVETFSLEQLIAKAEQCMRDFPSRIHGVVTYWDFPCTDILPILAAKFGLPGPTLKSVLKCEHKYWSRLEQQKVIAEHLPVFGAFDAYDEDAFTKLNMVPPFWVKPIKSFRSFLSYKVHDAAQFAEVLAQMREHLYYICDPFKYLFDAYHMPAEFREMSEQCIAESPLNGSMCTVEGYVYNGEVVVYGIVDSVREEDRSSFSRYVYPSSLPGEIQFRMADVARRAIDQIGLDDSPFNMEFFYDPTANQVYVLEINPRISQAHTDIFEKVHGVSHHDVMLNLALGRRPAPLELNGPFRVAANCMIRTNDLGRMRRVPTAEDIERVARDMPGTYVKLYVHEGMHLSELRGQDSYSYELANVFLGGRDQVDLLEKYNRCLELLPFEIERDEASIVY